MTPDIARMKRSLLALIAWVQRWKPVRAWARYTSARGPLLAQGLSFQAIFAVFAALWVAFAVAGFWIRANPTLQNALIDLLASAAPGLIDQGDGGAVSLDDLLSATILGWTGAIAAVGLAWTALGWLASGREAVRTVFGLPGSTRNFLLQRVIDVGIALGFGLAILASAALSVASTSALTFVLGWLGIGPDAVAASILARTAGIAVAFLLDAVVLGLFFRVVSGIPVPWRLLLPGTLVGALGLGVLKILGGALLGGATNNPLLASFAVLLGLLIWFNLVCQVILVAASWIADSTADAGVDVSGSEATVKSARRPLEHVHGPRLRAPHHLQERN